MQWHRAVIKKFGVIKESGTRIVVPQVQDHRDSCMITPWSRDVVHDHEGGLGSRASDVG